MATQCQSNKEGKGPEANVWAPCTGEPEGEFQARLQQAVRYKSEGNQYYKQKRVREAISRYHWALMHLRGLDPQEPSPAQAFGAEKGKLTAEETELLHTIECDCYNNLAACLLLSEKVNYERVRDYCLKVLQRQGDNSKALYRAGVALYHIGDYEQALCHLNKAAKICPNDANVRRFIQQAEQHLSRYHQKERSMYKGMFGK
ncbi:tetratricopeptide repeat protein 9C-like isoform X2 [Hemitrygon akajei]|uniref:tetratricopeptide repeat protein 9C-like isoform X2 n=1 Tax=Hemitrygon akajei TaxID=2704970 RepID=UPI003BF94F3E